MNVHSWRDVDSQANRYRAAIKESERLQMQVTGPELAMTVMHRQDKVYPVPVREGVFDRNKKSDGVKYADAKTKARKFELDTISQAYNPNRMVHVTAKDALINPYITIRHEEALPKKDPGYTPLDMQATFARD